jgi:hypothetical protein
MQPDVTPFRLSHETSVSEPSSDTTQEQSTPLEPEQSNPSEEMVDSDKKKCLLTTTWTS